MYWASRYDVQIEYLDLVLAQPRFVAANIGFYFVELCAAGDLEGVKKLLEDGVDVNSLGQSCKNVPTVPTSRC